jgi:hypothetical protein
VTLTGGGGGRLGCVGCDTLLGAEDGSLLAGSFPSRTGFGLVMRTGAEML